MNHSLLASALAHPATMMTFTLPEWDLLIRQARLADLLPRLAALAQHHGLNDQLPVEVRPHFEAARRWAHAQHEQVERELRELLRTLSVLQIPMVVLKGAAYIAARQPAAMGRTVSDLDILVPRAHLSEVEAQLLLNGWAGTHLHPYDQRYYRQWMHELPPMVHVRRGTSLDVHHHILPLTAAPRIPIDELWRPIRAVEGYSGLYTLSPIDQVLHSLAHLTFNDDLSHGLRDLSDLHLLLGAQAPTAPFWEELIERSAVLDLRGPLALALELCRRLLNTPLPEPMRHWLEHQAPGRRARRWLLPTLWCRALESQHPSQRPPGAAAAQFALYLRAHALRMPPHLLLPHLGSKLLRHWQDSVQHRQNAQEPTVRL